MSPLEKYAAKRRLLDRLLFKKLDESLSAKGVLARVAIDSPVHLAKLLKKSPDLAKQWALRAKKGKISKELKISGGILGSAALIKLLSSKKENK